MPKDGKGRPDKEIFLFEIDYFWTDRNAIAKAVISPAMNRCANGSFTAVKKLKFYRPPEGKKWSVFFLEKRKFVVSEVHNEEEAEIRIKVKKIVDSIAPDAELIFSTIAAALPPVR